MLVEQLGPGGRLHGAGVGAIETGATVCRVISGPAALPARHRLRFQAEVLERVIENIRERQAIRRLVRTLTAQGRLSRWIVSILPVGLLVFISAVNPSYMKPMFTHTSGKFMLGLGATMIVAGSLVIKKIVNIKE